MKKNIAPYVHHIYINFVANKALFTHKDESKYIELFIKRKLFSRVGFQQFVLKNSFLLGDRDRYYLDELSPTAKEKLGELAKNQEKKLLPKKCMKLTLQQANLLYSETELTNLRLVSSL